MTSLRHSASPAVSGIDGAVSPGVQAGSPRTSPSKVGASNLKADPSERGGKLTTIWASLRSRLLRDRPHGGASAAARLEGRASFNDCASADSAAQHDNSGSGAPGRVRRLLTPRASLLAGLGCNSPARSPNSDFALGGVDGDTQSQDPKEAYIGRSPQPRHAGLQRTCMAGSRFDSGPSAPFNDCGGESVEITATPRLRPSARGGYKQEAERLEPASVANPQGVSVGHRNASAPQSPICPELTAYITTLICVVGAVAWAHVYAMKTTLEGELTHFHPRVMFCDAVGNKAEKLCAVRHKEGE